ncbi:MAG: hypothetical protein JO041_11385 [Acidobacteria bacterium]|nr:hypothetical protein [Acidobacteriota bacterium]
MFIFRPWLRPFLEAGAETRLYGHGNASSDSVLERADLPALGLTTAFVEPSPGRDGINVGRAYGA